ncbi:outer membrane beta-barrel family protein [uncultured Kordia sp.]|uniref:outer membrane beta-barrel family protein n=1 Tax=uncultured Kordia sp. TaxID=507699 RepID=UPI0026204124|nr:outer membrane beta-barrel family protein [uncultured Kordia sp.]
MKNKITMQKKMRFTVFLCLFLVGFTAYGQIEVTGKVIDQETQKPIDFAEVILTNTKTQKIIGAITNLEGAFLLKAENGDYKFQVVFLGNSLYTKELSLTKSIDLGTISVTNNEELDAVTVEAKKKVIERKIDRVVFNVANSTQASQGDALELLKVAPGLRVQNNNISMIGKAQVAVMINDKIIQLANDELSNFLKSIASEDVESIEVITTPPAKYEAAGNSGLVNIKLKKAKKDSWNAQIRSYYRQQRYANSSFGGNFNYNKNKFSIAASGNYRKGDFYQEQDDYAFFPDGIWYTSSPFRSKTDGVNARIDLNYQVTPKWSMGAQYLYNRIDYNVTDAPFTPVFDNTTNEVIRSLQSEGRMDLTPILHSMNYNNEIELDTLGRNVSINLDYFAYDNPDTKRYNGVSTVQNPFSEQFYRGINTNNQDVKSFSAKVDVEMPTKWASIDFGGKFTKSTSQNDIFFFNSGLVNTPVTNLPISQNDFEYDEDIQALYVSASKDLGEKWSTKIGLRLEATQTNSTSNNLGLNVDNDYTKLFPTFYLSYKATENSSFSMDYSKRIQRPNFFQLNPNIYFLNPFQTIEGNAFLQPSFVDNIRLVHSYKNLTSTFFFLSIDESFAQVPLPDANTNIIRFTNENYIDTQRFGIYENYYFNKYSWWSSNNNFVVNYTISKFDLVQEEEDQKGFNATVSTYNDFTLNSEKTLFASANYWYAFPGVNGIFETKSASALSLSIQYLLLNKDMNITLRANDIFKTSADRTEAVINNVLQTARYYYDNRSIQLSVSYKFGNKDISAKRHATGNEDERGRTGN